MVYELFFLRGINKCPDNMLAVFVNGIRAVNLTLTRLDRCQNYGIFEIIRHYLYRLFFYFFYCSCTWAGYVIRVILPSCPGSGSLGFPAVFSGVLLAEVDGVGDKWPRNTMTDDV
jgi:hypothetical protein